MYKLYQYNSSTSNVSIYFILHKFHFNLFFLTIFLSFYVRPLVFFFLLYFRLLFRFIFPFFLALSSCEFVRISLSRPLNRCQSNNFSVQLHPINRDMLEAHDQLRFLYFLYQQKFHRNNNMLVLAFHFQIFNDNNISYKHYVVYI